MESSPLSRAWPRPLKLAVVLLVLAALYGVYLLVMAGVRRHVDDLVDRSVGREVVAFDLADRDGNRVRAADLRGRVAVLNFFRSRCHGCFAEAPVIRELAQRADPARVAVIGVMMDAVEGYDPAVTADTLARMAYTHPVVMADAAFVDAFHGAGWAHVTPVTYVVGPDGRIAESLRGVHTLAELERAVAAASR